MNCLLLTTVTLIYLVVCIDEGLKATTLNEKS